jgi:predicted nucleotidyltransferase
MTRSQIFSTLTPHRDEIRRFGVRGLRLFGSAVRDEAGEDSDLDFLVDLDPATFDNYMDLKFFLEDLFGRKVDLVLADTIKPRLRERILEEAVHAPGF